jgi:hypothetical protein
VALWLPGGTKRRCLLAAQLIPSRVPLTDPPGDRLAEIVNLVNPRQRGPDGPLVTSKGRCFGMAELKKGSRITGAARDKLGSRLVKKYEKGASIWALVQETGRSYGFIHRVLSESGVTLRGRGGATRTKKK